MYRLRVEWIVKGLDGKPAVEKVVGYVGQLPVIGEIFNLTLTINRTRIEVSFGKVLEGNIWGKVFYIRTEVGVFDIEILSRSIPDACKEPESNVLLFRKPTAKRAKEFDQLIQTLKEMND